MARLPSESMSPNIRLEITNTSEELIDLCVSTMGGHKESYEPRGLSTKPFFRWAIASKGGIKDILVKLEPHLVVKKDLAQLMLQLIDLMPGRNKSDLGHYKELTEEELLPMYIVLSKIIEINKAR